MDKEDFQENPKPQKEVSNQAPRSFVRRNWLILLLLSIILIVVSVFLILQSPLEGTETYTPEDLYYANFEAFPNLLSPLENKEATSTSDDLQLALQLYQEEKYLAAIDSIQPLLAQQSNDDLLLYQSIAQLATDQNTDALINLSQIVENQQTNYELQTKWYLALAYLKIGATEDAITLLEELAAQETGFKKNRSAAILQILNETE